MLEVDTKLKAYLREYGIPMEQYRTQIRVMGKDEYLRLEVRYTHIETKREIYFGCVSVDADGELQPFQASLQ